jgi:hypothetical protein
MMEVLADISIGEKSTFSVNHLLGLTLSAVCFAILMGAQRVFDHVQVAD